MDYAEALKKIEGAESVGGQLIVHREGRNILVGKNVQGVLIVEETAEAKLIVEGSPDAPEPEPKTHDVDVHDTVEAKDRLANKK